MSGRDRVFHWVTYNLWYIDWYMQGHGLYYWLVYGVSLTVCYITDGVLNDVCCVAYALSSYNVMNTMHMYSIPYRCTTMSDKGVVACCCVVCSEVMLLLFVVHTYPVHFDCNDVMCNCVDIDTCIYIVQCIVAG